MSSEKPTTIVSEKDLENAERQRAESICDQKPEILDPVKTNAEIDEKVSVVDYVGSKARSVVAKIPPLTAEVVMFLYMFSSSLRSTSSTSMIIDKVCLVNLGYAGNVCNNLKDHPTTKSEVEKMANNYSLGYSMIQMLPSSVMALFIGSWSDKYGRKFPMILALAGMIVDGFGSSICAYFLHSRVEYYYIPASFTGVSGGFIGVLTILYAYISDISTSGNRTIKYAIMELAFGMAMPLGSLAGGWIFKFYGYVPVFVASTCGHVLGLCCVVFCLQETRGLETTDDWITKFRSFWSLEGVKSSFKATAKRRPNKGRAQIWLLILAMSIIVFSYASQMSVTFLFVHHQFDWDNTTFSTVSSIYMAIGFIMMMIVVPLGKKLNVGDPTLGVLGSVSLMLKNVGTGLANKIWIYHVAMITGLLTSLSTLAGRARISKVIPKEDLGKVFAFVSTAESLLPIAATSVVSQALNATLDFFPGLIFVIMGILMVIPIGVFVWVSRLPVLSYEEMNEGDQKDPEAKVQATQEPSTSKH